jgi:hypothetical protein
MSDMLIRFFRLLMQQQMPHALNGSFSDHVAAQMAYPSSQDLSIRPSQDAYQM